MSYSSVIDNKKNIYLYLLSVKCLFTLIIYMINAKGIFHKKYLKYNRLIVLIVSSQ